MELQDEDRRTLLSMSGRQTTICVRPVASRVRGYFSRLSAKPATGLRFLPSPPISLQLVPASGCRLTLAFSFMLVSPWNFATALGALRSPSGRMRTAPSGWAILCGGATRVLQASYSKT